MRITDTQQTIRQPLQHFHVGENTFVWLTVMVVLWGLSWPATKLALDIISPLWLASFRFGSAAICLFIFITIRGQLKFPPKSDWPIVASMGLLQMMAFTGLGMIAMTHIDAGRAVLLAYTTPLWGVMIGWLVLREVPTKLQLLALIIGLIGIGFIISPTEMDWSKPGTLVGALFLIVAAICWSIVILHVKRHRWASTPLSLAPWQMLLATIPLAAFAFIREGSPIAIPFDSHLLGLLFFIGPIATSACFVISAEYGRRISTFSMSNFTLGVPLVGIGASVILTNNHLTPLFSLGIILIIIGVILAATVAKKSQSINE